MAENKKNVTFSVNENAKREFQAECVLNGNDMSEVIETFMTSYTRSSKKMREEKTS